MADIKNAQNPQTRIVMRRSPYTETVDRYYEKLLDVASYVGGLAPAFISAFFFLKMFGLYFFEMTFAHQYFRRNETKNHGFFSYLKK